MNHSGRLATTNKKIPTASMKIKQVLITTEVSDFVIKCRRKAY